MSPKSNDFNLEDKSILKFQVCWLTMNTLFFLWLFKRFNKEFDSYILSLQTIRLLPTISGSKKSDILSKNCNLIFPIYFPIKYLQGIL